MFVWNWRRAVPLFLLGIWLAPGNFLVAKQRRSKTHRRR